MLHAYGLKKHRSVTDVTALVLQALYLAYVWGKGLIVTVQDVLTAFDEMDHAMISSSLLSQAARCSLAGLSMQELYGMRAVM